ncbi:type II toxin-antitoxin system HicB family antitoxin [Streptococcus sp. E17BB]|uniref:type II toxin-antitoxin system HicB family antitoxin n=1 Tax=Streptococcus sp. E17BB TaxID=3278714 RepID=UPI00359D64DD
MLVTYPALFYYDDTEGENTVPYFVHFPDIEGSGTQGSSITDAMAMGAEYLGMMVSHYIENGEPVPQPSSINSLSLIDNDPFKDDADFTLTYDLDKSFISLVTVDVAEYLGQQEPIKKTLTIPRWADKVGRELGINFSQTLTKAIAERRLQS